MGEQATTGRQGVTSLSRVTLHPTAKIYGESKVGEGSIILDDMVIGYPKQKHIREMQDEGLLDFNGPWGARIGPDALIRSKSVIYADVTVGRGLRTGHGVMIREDTRVGDEVLIGTNTVIDGQTTIGSNVSIQTGVYIPASTSIGDRVFLGPCCILTNDLYPVRDDTDLQGPRIRLGASIGANATILPEVEVGERVAIAPRVTLLASSHCNNSRLRPMVEPLCQTGRIVIEDDAWIGAGAIILPNVTIGEGAIVGSGAVVTGDVPPYTVVAGVPARRIKDITPTIYQ